MKVIHVVPISHGCPVVIFEPAVNGVLIEYRILNPPLHLVAHDGLAPSLARVLRGFKAAHMSQRAMVDELNKLGIKTARGNEWSLVQLQRVLARLG